MDNSEKRIDVVAFLTYKGSELRLWITVTERMDVGCIIEAKIYHKMDESTEADECLSYISRRIDEELSRV